MLRRQAAEQTQTRARRLRDNGRPYGAITGDLVVQLSVAPAPQRVRALVSLLTVLGLTLFLSWVAAPGGALTSCHRGIEEVLMVPSQVV